MKRNRIILAFAAAVTLIVGGLVEAQRYTGIYPYLGYGLNASGASIPLSVDSNGHLLVTAGHGNGFAAAVVAPKGIYPALMHALFGGNPTPLSVDATGALLMNGGQIIQQQTMASNTASVTFSSIPQIYTNLRLVITGQSGTGFDTVLLTVNGASSAYNGTGFSVVGTTITGITSPTTAFSTGVTFATLGQSASTTIDCSFNGYTVTVAGTTKPIMCSMTSYSGTSFQMADMRGQWNSGGVATTSITASFASTGTFAAGTVLTLYGY